MADAGFTDEDFIRYIYKTELINEILTNIVTVCTRAHPKTFTKDMARRISTSCRNWVLFYTLLYNYNLLNKNIILEHQTKLGEIGPSLKELCDIYINILADRRSQYYDIFMRNKPSGVFLTQINIHTELGAVPERKYQHWQMCIHNTTGIFHYFIIFRQEEKYFITSSYASDNVSVPQFTTEIEDIGEFNAYLHNTNTNNKDESYYNFIEKYFLSNNLVKRYDEDTIEGDEKLKSLWIKPKEGIKMEKRFYEQHSEQLSVSIINGYDEYIIAHIHKFKEGKSGAGRKSKRKKRRVRRRGTKGHSRRTQVKKSKGRRKSKNK